MKKALLKLIYIASFSFLLWGCSCDNPPVEQRIITIKFEFRNEVEGEEFFMLEKEVIEGRDYFLTLPENTFSKEEYYFVNWKRREIKYFENDEFLARSIDMKNDYVFTFYAEWSNLVYDNDFILKPSADKSEYGIVGYEVDPLLVSILDIPSHYGEVPITYIDELAFSNFKNLETVNFSLTLKKVYKGAFKGCDNLNNVDIPDNIIEIGDYVFSDCYNLESISLPKDLLEINEGLFMRCYKLSEITIPSNVRVIGASSFCECHSLVNLTLPSMVKRIQNNAFAHCINLVSINLPESLNFIEGGAFFNCSKLGSIILPSYLQQIQNYAFKGCEGLTSILVPSRVDEMGSKVFDDCVNLLAINISFVGEEWADDWLGNCQATIN